MIRGDNLKRGQLGIEYVILTGLLLIFFIPVIHYALTESNKNVKVSQLESMINRLAKASDAIYTLGPGSSEIIVVTVPKGVEGVYIGNKMILMNVSGLGEVLAFTKANISGTIPIIEGTYHLPVKVLDNGVVRIGKGPFITALSPTSLCDDMQPDPYIDQSFSILGGNFWPNSLSPSPVIAEYQSPGGFAPMPPAITINITDDTIITVTIPPQCPGLIHAPPPPGGSGINDCTGLSSSQCACVTLEPQFCTTTCLTGAFNLRVKNTETEEVSNSEAIYFNNC